jgi:hypothetical protein
MIDAPHTYAYMRACTHYSYAHIYLYSHAVLAPLSISQVKMLQHVLENFQTRVLNDFDR